MARGKKPKRLVNIPGRDLLGRAVRLLRTLQTRGGKTFPAGSVMYIVQKYHGLSLCADAPPAHRHDITKVPFDSVELMPDETTAGTQSAQSAQITTAEQ